jgi:preprotein translocase subunit SecD
MEKIKKTGKVRPELGTNVSLMGTMRRAIAAVLLPVFVLLIDHHLLIWVAPISMYLLVCVLTHFDVIKWAWLRLKKKPEPNMDEFWDEE